MSSIINGDKQNDSLTLITLISDLEGVTEQFNQISVGFDQGEIDFAGFELALLQLQDCQDLLEEILDNRQRTVSGQ
jgi:hypothetical protein